MSIRSLYRAKSASCETVQPEISLRSLKSVLLAGLENVNNIGMHNSEGFGDDEEPSYRSLYSKNDDSGERDSGEEGNDVLPESRRNMKRPFAQMSTGDTTHRFHFGEMTEVLDNMLMDETKNTPMQGSKQAQALRMALHAKADEPIGTASIASCLALVLALITDKPTQAQLWSFLGFKDVKQLLTLKDPYRVLSVLLSTNARSALTNSPNGAMCFKLWEVLGAECIPLEREVETQINQMLKTVWEIDYDVFKPYQIVPIDHVESLIAVLVSMEKIKVSWKTEFDNYMPGTFTTSSGQLAQAQFCVNQKARAMHHLSFEGGEAVLLPCKPDEKTGKERGMIFVLPEKGMENDLNACLRALADHADKSANGIVFGYLSNYLFSFPAFNAQKAPASIKPWLARLIPNIFDSFSFCMEGTLPTDKIGGYPAYVADVQHGASIKADRQGAVADAVTVTTAYRSLASHPKFKCDRPFISILATLKPGTVTPEIDNIEFVTKHETEKTMDLKVNR